MPAGEAQSFSASWDATAKVITAVVLALFLAIAVATGSTIVAGLEAVLFFLSYAYSPRGYVVRDKALIVTRFIGNVRISLDGIRGLRTAAANDLSGCIRLWGSGGLFGWYGLFRTSKLGKCTWYVTDRGRAVVLVTGTKTVVISPDDVDGFVAAIRAAVPVPAIAPVDPLLDAMGSYPAGSLTGKLIGGGVAIVAIAIGALAWSYSPGPPGYTLTPQTLTIHDRFYPVTLNAANVDVAGIRIVNLTVDTNWQPTIRTNGFANEHYHAGWFQVAGGGKVRMYRADGKRLVLLPPAGDGAAVLLETRDPEKFVREVKQEWSGRG